MDLNPIGHYVKIDKLIFTGMGGAKNSNGNVEKNRDIGSTL